MLPASRVRLYREHQFELTQPTHRSDQFQPGWYPDGLIPQPSAQRRAVAGARLSIFNRRPPKPTLLDRPGGARRQARPIPGVYRVTAADAVEMRRSPSGILSCRGSPLLHRTRRPSGCGATNGGPSRKEQPPAMAAIDNRRPTAHAAPHQRHTPSGSPRGPARQRLSDPRRADQAARTFVDRYHVSIPIRPRTAVKDEAERAAPRLVGVGPGGQELTARRPLLHLPPRQANDGGVPLRAEVGRAIRMPIPSSGSSSNRHGPRRKPGAISTAPDIWCRCSPCSSPKAPRRCARQWSDPALCQGRRRPGGTPTSPAQLSRPA